MKRIIIRHLSGTRANQTDTLDLDRTHEVILGRDPSAHIAFDPDRDDLVSRKHAKIVRVHADPPVFSLTDLKSQNGTVLNGQSVRGPVELNPGDVIQLGQNGPKIRFDIDPRPPVAKATRIVSGTEGLTRAASLDPSTEAKTRTLANRLRPESPQQSSGKPAVGHATVERMIFRTQRETRSRMLVIGGLVGSILLMGIGWFAYQSYIDKELTERKIQDAVAQAERKHQQTLKQLEANRPISSAEIAERYSGSTVMIEESWKLYHVATGQQLYHRYGKYCAQWQQTRKGSRCKKWSDVLPFYTLQSGRLEPLLTTDPVGLPIGGQGHGSGFVVSPDGFILTNRHVAASWETRYAANKLSLPGVLQRCPDLRDPKCHAYLHPRDPRIQRLIQTLYTWVPTKSNILGGKQASGKSSEGKHMYLDVVFPNSRQRIAARLVRVSDHADAALIKIDTLRPLQPVEFGDDSVRPGDAITVLGYPGISPDFKVKIKSEDTFNRESEWRTIPQATVTSGNIGKVLTSKNLPDDESITDYFGSFTEAYQLTINATGAGNSGGPVFDHKGKVIGIFTAGSSSGGTAITFAIPIKFGTELTTY